MSDQPKVGTAAEAYESLNPPIFAEAAMRALLQGAPAADMTTAKAELVAKRNFRYCGVVLVSDTGEVAIVDRSAVRWLHKDDHWALMHGSPVSYSANQEEQNKAQAARNATDAAHQLLKRWLEFAKDVTTSCPAGYEWITDLRKATEHALLQPPFPAAEKLEYVTRYQHKDGFKDTTDFIGVDNVGDVWIVRRDGTRTGSCRTESCGYSVKECEWKVNSGIWKKL